jgi:glucokinase
MSRKDDTVILAGDLGGTKTLLALYTSDAGARTPIREETFSSPHYPSLEAMVDAFVSKAAVRIDRAVFGVAGPVLGREARITNLPWVIREKNLRKALKIPSIHLLNDLEALAHAVPILEPADLRTLNKGTPAAGGAIAVIAPGTGLGEAFLTLEKGGTGTRYMPHPSEGGHADFAPVDSLQHELLVHLQKRFAHVSCEKVCSGPGIYEIYCFLRSSGRGEEQAWLAKELAHATDPTPVIVKAAFNKGRPCGLCRKALDLFISILGAEAGNFALKILATKGVYIGGGIPPAILPALKKKAFLQAFRDKGRMSELLSRVPVFVITNPGSALLGAAHFGLTMCE